MRENCKGNKAFTIQGLLCILISLLRKYYAPVVKRISRLSSEQLMQVRVLPGAPQTYDPRKNEISP